MRVGHEAMKLLGKNNICSYTNDVLFIQISTTYKHTVMIKYTYYTSVDLLLGGNIFEPIGSDLGMSA